MPATTVPRTTVPTTSPSSVPVSQSSFNPFVVPTTTSLRYTTPAPLNLSAYTYLVNTVEIISNKTISQNNIFIYEKGGILYININNLLPATNYSSVLTCSISGGSSIITNLPSARTLDITQSLATLDYTIPSATLPTTSLSQKTLVTTLGYNPGLITPSKLNFLYNYYDYDYLTYPLVRLYGYWSNARSGNLTVTINGYSNGVNWKFYNNEFKIYTYLFSSGRATYGQTNGLNTIVISDGTTQKTVHLYYVKTTVASDVPHVKCILYDGSNGTGTCDAPPSRPDNKLTDNQARMKLDALLLQSFFAESYKASREKQEGLTGLPYTTFVLDLDANDQPNIYYVKSLRHTREQFWSNGLSGDAGSIAALTALYGNSCAFNGGNIYFIGFSIVSHLDPTTGTYYSGFAGGGNGLGLLNGANLIWHPKTLSEIQVAWNDTTSLPTDYTVYDNASTVADSCGRIIGSLMHELIHTILNSDHPDEIINIWQSKPSSFLFPFDAELYQIPFGIDHDQATYFRNWVMAYNTDLTPISRIYSELGGGDEGSPSYGWWSPYSIHGYVNINQAVQRGFNGFSKVLISATNATTKEVIVDSSTKLTNNTPLVLCFGSTGSTFGGLSTGTVYYVHAIISSTSIQLKTSVTDSSAMNLITASTGSSIIAVISSSGLHNSLDRFGWANCDVLRPHPKKSTLTTVSTGDYLNIQLPSDLQTGYLVANIWGAGGSKAMNAAYGGAGGFMQLNIPIKNTDSIDISIGTSNGTIGGGGQSNTRSGGPYGANGGGRTTLFINNLPLCMVGGGGGGGMLYPGRSVLQTTTYSIYDGTDAILASGGGDNLEFDDNNMAGCGGGGFCGGSSGKYIDNMNGGGGGYGSSYIYGKIPGFSVEKPAVPVVVSSDGTNNTSSVGVGIKHLIPSIYETYQDTFGNSGRHGGLVYKFIYTNPALLMTYTSPTASSLIIPSIDTLDMPSNLTLIPRPLSYIATSDYCIFNTSVSIYYSDASFSGHANVLKQEFFNLTGILPTTILGTMTSSVSYPSIYLFKDNTLIDSDNKYYKFNIRVATSYVQINASDLIGLSHGTSSFLQLLRVDPTIKIQTTTISDYATCSDTGLMIDIARDYYEMSILYRLIDMCRFYKMRYIHIHGNDESGDVAMVYYWNPSGSVAAGDPTTMPNDGGWYRSKTNWDNLVEYARIRGVAFIPELEAYGRGAGLRSRFPNTFGSNVELFNLVSDACITGLQSIITQLASTFYTSPYIMIGNDETNDSNAYTIPGAETFCRNKNLTFNNETICNFYFYRLYQIITRLNKKMFTWENVNSSFTGTDGTQYTTNNNVICQIWKINGGAVGADGYVPGGQEDGTPYNLHSGTQSYITSGISIRQTPWKPRIYSSMKAMFDWGPALGLNTSILTGSIFERVSNPIPITPKLLGGETLLWEAGIYHNIKYSLLRYKAPMRVENTYSAGKNSTSWNNSFTAAFDYLNNRLDTLSSGIRLVESGISHSLGYLAGMETDALIPYAEFKDILVLTLIKNNPTYKIYYTLSASLSTYPIVSGNGQPMLDNRGISSEAKLYTGPITISRYSGLLSNGFVSFKAQTYTSSNVPVGELIDRRYVCMPYTIKFAGSMRNPNLEGTYGAETLSTLYFNNKLTITVEDVPTDGTLRYSIGDQLTSNSSILLTTQQIQITASSSPVNIGFFDNNNLCSGKVTSINTYCTNDMGSSLNTYSITPKSSFNITNVYINSTTVRLAALLSSVANSPGGVKITCTVVGGGGSGTGTGGGGGGGISIETYYNVSTLYTLVIEVGTAGNQSSLSFTPISLIGASGAGDRNIGSVNVNKLQHPIYPTIAYGGSNASGTTAGIRGTITRGDVVSAIDATSGSSSVYGSGGRGYVYNSIEYGRGSDGGSGTSGTQGIVIINIQPI